MLLTLPNLVRPRPTMTRLSVLTDTVDRTVYTFSSVNIGEARQDKCLVLVSFVQLGASGGSPIASMTFNGAGPIDSAVINSAGTAVKGMIGFYKVPNISSANIVVTAPAAAVNCYVQGWYFTGLSKNNGFVSTQNFGGNGPNPKNGNIDIKAGGYAVGGLLRGGTIGTSAWTVLSEFADTSIETLGYSLAEYSTNIGVATTFAETVTWTGGGNGGLLIGTVR